MASLLTPRWFELPEKAVTHKVQTEWINNMKTNKFEVFTVVGGRRSYKTERGKRYMTYCNTNSNEKIFYCGAPTRIQAKDIFWKDLKALIPPFLIKTISESELLIETKYNSILKVIGLKEFKRVQGSRCHGVLISEFQECDPAVYTESFEPMLNDTGGFAILEGRPLGKNHLFDFYNRGINGEKGFGSYHWTAEDILSKEQIIKAKARQALQDYRREYLADFETESGSPYYAYSDLNNKSYQFNPNKPLIVTCDFNATVKPMSWVVGQKTIESGREITYWFKCLSFTYTNTQTMCGILDDYLKTLHSYPVTINFYGDYSGGADKSNSSYTDWEIIENYYRNKVNFVKNIKFCKSIRNSIGATNAQLCNSLNEHKQFINPETCKELVLDWQKADWKSNSKELEDKDDLRTHSCRAVDYYNDYEYPVKEGYSGKQW